MTMKMTQRERGELAVLIREEMVNGYTRELVVKALAQMQEDYDTAEKLVSEVGGLKVALGMKEERIQRLLEDLAFGRGDYDD
jgi:hypothetical protein